MTFNLKNKILKHFKTCITILQNILCFDYRTKSIFCQVHQTMDVWNVQTVVVNENKNNS